MSAHAVITNDQGQVLLLKRRNFDQSWGLPGGALEPGETILDGIVRECAEELGAQVKVMYLSGVYLHVDLNCHNFIFRCELPRGSQPVLSEEHTEWRYFGFDELPPEQHQKVQDCLTFQRTVSAGRF